MQLGMGNQIATYHLGYQLRASLRPHRDDVFNIGAECHAVLAKSNGIFPFTYPIMNLQGFLFNIKKTANNYEKMI